ncbi:MAG TPA: phytanoyl-CoA dioxygenase family protein [Acidimicrobiales bacterium]
MGEQGSTSFERFHREDLPAALAARDGGRAAAREAGEGRAIAFRLTDGTTFTYRAHAGGIAIEPGDRASTVIELDELAFDDLVNERFTIFGLLYPGRLNVARGSFDELASWEAALTNLWTGRAIYDDEATDLRDRDGRPLDLHATFVLADVPASAQREADADAAHFLHTAGFVVLRGVFSRDEIDALDAEVRRLRAQATPTDNRSWWAKNADGEEVCCRLTYTSERSELIWNLQHDARLVRIASWHGDELRPTPDRLDGFSVVIKNSDVVEGLSDLPWHRDCGLGGHPVLCPTLLMGIQLDRADAANGQLWYLAGSHRHTNRIDAVEQHPEWPIVRVDAEPGDVTVHYSHVLHVAPPPTGLNAGRRTLYVSFNNPAVFDVIPPGRGYNDVVYSQGDGRVRSPAELTR